MPDRTNTNPKANNRENKRNDINRPKGKKGTEKNPSIIENFNGEPIE
jgi:hypothetical protein